MRIFILVLGLLLLSNANARDLDGKYLVYGNGTSSCATYLVARKEKSHQPFLQWFGGYLTARNELSVMYKDLTQTDILQIIEWVDQYCRDYPNDRFAFAAAALVSSAERYGILPPYGAIPILIEQDDGSFVAAKDKATGLPLFEIDGKEQPLRGLLHSAKESTTKDIGDGLLGNALLGPAKLNAYGPGLHSDSTGRSFIFRTRDGESTRDPVKLDSYGPGVHMDQYGRPVYAVPK
jgi:hypothetical protein